MNINQIPARGFGPQASIGGVVTTGFDTQAAPPPVTKPIQRCGMTKYKHKR